MAKMPHSQGAHEERRGRKGRRAKNNLEVEAAMKGTL
jgi:hypothetical protein